MDNMATIMMTDLCTTRLLNKLNSNLQQDSIQQFKGKVVDNKFVVNDVVVPTVQETPMKSLGRGYDASLSDKAVCRTETEDHSENIEKSRLPGKLKPWCLHFGLLPQLMLPLTVH